MINMDNKMIKIIMLIIATSVFVVAVFICIRSSDDSDEYIKISSEQAVRTITVEERSITSVLVLSANVVSSPMYRVTAPVDGTIKELNDGSIGIELGNSIKNYNDIISRDGSVKMPEVKGKEVHSIQLHESSKIESLLVPPGTTVKKGLPVLNVRHIGFALQAAIPPEKMYRLYDGIISVRGEIMNGPGPFDCQLLGVPFVPGANGNSIPEAKSQDSLWRGYLHQLDITQGVVVVATVPMELNLLEGSPGLLALTTAEVEKAVALPVEAVAGISQRGQVYVDNEGAPELRDVTLGITDGSYVQITSGLSVGEKIILPSPSISNLK